MKSIFFFCLTFIAIILFSCTSENTKQVDSSIAEKKVSVASCLDDSLILLDTTTEIKWFNNLPDTFTRIPEAFCGIAPLCEYRINKNDWSNEFLISAGDSGLAMILIDKKLVLLKWVFLHDTIEEYSNATYTVTIVTNNLDSIDEGSVDKEGTITIKSKSGNMQVKKYYGNCSP